MLASLGVSDLHAETLELYLEGMLYPKHTHAHQDADNMKGGHQNGEYGSVALASQCLSTEKLHVT